MQELSRKKGEGLLPAANPLTQERPAMCCRRGTGGQLKPKNGIF